MYADPNDRGEWLEDVSPVVLDSPEVAKALDGKGVGGVSLADTEITIRGHHLFVAVGNYYEKDRNVVAEFLLSRDALRRILDKHDDDLGFNIGSFRNGDMDIRGRPTSLDAKRDQAMLAQGRAYAASLQRRLLEACKQAKPGQAVPIPAESTPPSRRRQALGMLLSAASLAITFWTIYATVGF